MEYGVYVYLLIMIDSKFDAKTPGVFLALHHRAVFNGRQNFQTVCIPGNGLCARVHFIQGLKLCQVAQTIQVMPFLDLGMRVQWNRGCRE